MDRRQPPPPSSRSRMRYIPIIILMDDSIYSYCPWLIGELERKMCFLFFSTVSSQNASQKTMPNNTTKAGVVVETMSAPNPVSKLILNNCITIRTLHSQFNLYVLLILRFTSVLSKHAWNLLFDGTDKSRTYTSCHWLHHCAATSGASIRMVSIRIELSYKLLLK